MKTFLPNIESIDTGGGGLSLSVVGLLYILLNLFGVISISESIPVETDKMLKLSMLGNIVCYFCHLSACFFFQFNSF